MPVSDKVDYMTLLQQMYNALYEPEHRTRFAPASDPSLSRYRVLLVPPLYSASDRELQGLRSM